MARIEAWVAARSNPRSINGKENSMVVLRKAANPLSWSNKMVRWSTQAD